MTYNSAEFDSACADGTIVNYLHSSEGLQIIQESIRHWLSRQVLVMKLLSKEIVEVSSKVLSSAIIAAVRQVVVEELRPQIVEFVGKVLDSTLHPKRERVGRQRDVIHSGDFCASEYLVTNPAP